MPRTKASRPERAREQRRRAHAANEWYYGEAARRAVPLDEAQEYWESLTPIARVRRFMSAVRAGDEAACAVHDRRFSDGQIGLS